ncbi:MAG: reductive dehalogenase domain-containing protein, partial [Pseudomonadota bacterium]
MGIIRSRNEFRSYDLGQFPFESLPKDPSVLQSESERPPIAQPGYHAATGHLAEIAQHYSDLFSQSHDGDVAPAQAPVPEDLSRRSMDIKGAIYFLDAAHVGICKIPTNAWYHGQAIPEHQYAIVIVIEHGRLPESDNLAHAWVTDAVEEASVMRGVEISAGISGYIRLLGFSAKAHFPGQSDIDLSRLSVLAGVTFRGGETVQSPYLGTGISIVAVTTSYTLATDAPIAAAPEVASSSAYRRGINGAESGKERDRRAKRATHLSRYPMEQVKRVERPTTLILDDEVPRVPRRAEFFERAKYGDLGDKAQAERNRFAYKHPLAGGLMPIIGCMAGSQDGPVEDSPLDSYQDPSANARALKSLGHFLGADLVGICEVPRYAWYSHRGNGKPIEPYHNYAVVMLIDQGYDTMEGASGDDWISGVQSMRAYMRGAEIAGVMGGLLRKLGFPARSQTQVDSDVLHIPLLLWAGLGELSRIGELVLNPFVGPRFKSVVLTTDMPLEVDKPIDFGLQYFCNNCLKCARECPCDAIPTTTQKVMFNGYEMWKPDVERCTRYRLTNQKGSACGRCMKTCPLNKITGQDAPTIHRLGTWLGVNAMWLKPLLVPIAVKLDDYFGYGKRNLAKKWWLDLEIVDGVCVKPVKGSNERELDVTRKLNTNTEKIVYYHANMMPAPNEKNTVPLVRKAAKEAVIKIETPKMALTRRESNEAIPE